MSAKRYHDHLSSDEIPLPSTRPPLRRIEAVQWNLCTFLHVLMNFFCEKLIFINPAEVKVILYGLIVVFGSLCRSFGVVPHSPFFSSKANLLNQYFVKLGWGWTLSMVLPFIVIANGSMLRAIGLSSPSDLPRLVPDLTRVFLATCIWFAVTSSLRKVAEVSGGFCAHFDNASTRLQCLENGGQWNHWMDISGHVFLLTFSSLVMNEESKSMARWKAIGRELRSACQENGRDASILLKLKSYEQWNVFVTSLYYGQAMLTVLWEVMIVSTSLYFHTIMHKLLAYLISTLSWYILYRLMFDQPGPTVHHRQLYAADTKTSSCCHR